MFLDIYMRGMLTLESPCFETTTRQDAHVKRLLMGSAPMGSARKRAFVKNVTFGVQTAPFDKITTDFWRSRRRLYIPDLLKTKKMRRQIIIF